MDCSSSGIVDSVLTVIVVITFLFFIYMALRKL